MACAPRVAPLRSPDPLTISRDDTVVSVLTVPVDGAEYVIRAGARGQDATIIVRLRGNAGLEELASEVVAAGSLKRITLPSVLAGEQLEVLVKGKKGGVVALDIGWRPW